MQLHLRHYRYLTGRLRFGYLRLRYILPPHHLKLSYLDSRAFRYQARFRRKRILDFRYEDSLNFLLVRIRHFYLQLLR